MVLPMIFSLDSISQTKLNTCLLKINNPNQLILHCTIEYHPWYLEDIIRLHYILRILMNTTYLFFHHPFCLVMLLFDCILLKSLDIKCRGHLQHFIFPHVFIEFMVRNTILAPRWFVLSSTTSFDSLPIQTWSYILLFFPSGKIYTWYLLTNTFCFPLVWLTFLWI
jgi:hypothetical protein